MNPLQTSEQSSGNNCETSVPPSEKRCGCDEEPSARVKNLILLIKLFEKLKEFKEYIEFASKHISEESEVLKLNEGNECGCDCEISRVCNRCSDLEECKEGVKGTKKEKQELLANNPWLISRPDKLLRACIHNQDLETSVSRFLACIYSSNQDLETSDSRFLACSHNCSEILIQNGVSIKNGVSIELSEYIEKYLEEIQLWRSKLSVRNPLSIYFY